MYAKHLFYWNASIHRRQLVSSNYIKRLPSFDFFGGVLNFWDWISAKWLKIFKKVKKKSFNKNLLNWWLFEAQLFVWICDGWEFNTSFAIDGILESRMICIQFCTVHEDILHFIQVGYFSWKPINISEI